ncbi:MAG: binding-protein-dependent transport system inner rane component, partial [Polaromonas sp.]|nr:binding-protein-dependent transport system inner rane component [Polaromonas sp.]
VLLGVVLLLNLLIALVRRWRERVDDALPDLDVVLAAAPAARGAPS